MPPPKNRKRAAATEKTTEAKGKAKKIDNISSPPTQTTVIKGKGETSNSTKFSDFVTDKEWSQALLSEFKKDYFTNLESHIDGEITSGTQVFPPRELIFNALNRTPLCCVKAVILGQDPYHDDGQAMGLAFSVPRGIKVPPSLKNMYKELAGDIDGFQVPGHGCLEKWTDQGVLLLNATLTVQAHKPNSHSKYGWQTFTDNIIRAVSDKCNGVVFLLWGNFAHKKEKLIDASKHTILKDAHPSPLSFGKFKGCKCFSRANEALEKNGKTSIDWCL